jgi:hypothetical protein
MHQPRFCFLLCKNWHVNSMHAFCLNSTELSKITHQKYCPCFILKLPIYEFGTFLEGDIPINYDDIFFPLIMNRVIFISYTKHCMLFAFFFLKDSLLIITYFKWRIFSCRTCKTRPLHSYYIRKNVGKLECQGK